MLAAPAPLVEKDRSTPEASSPGLKDRPCPSCARLRPSASCWPTARRAISARAAAT